jgi:hypothetical protein
MTQQQGFQPSFVELALKARSVILLGCGGGGDVVQTIPVLNFLRQVGVKQFCLANMGGKWWGGELGFGCEVLNLDWLSASTRLGRHAALVSPDTVITSGRGKGERPHEAVLALETGLPSATIDLAGGLPGVVAGLRALTEYVRADLLVVVDIGSDSFYSGEETTVQSPLIDALSLCAATSLSIPAAFGLVGYGCDAEMPLAHLHRNVGRAMQQGGFLGAYGITRQDAADLKRILDHFPLADIETRPYKAAQGVLGSFYCKRFWAIEILPLAAIVLFFDPQIIVDYINPLPNAIGQTRTLAEAEEAIMRHGLFPETRLPQVISAPTAPQVADANSAQ